MSRGYHDPGQDVTRRAPHLCDGLSKAPRPPQLIISKMTRKPQIGRTCTGYPASTAQGCQDGETQGKTKTLSQTRGDRETTKALG